MIDKITKTFLWLSAVFCAICMCMCVFVAIYANPDGDANQTTSNRQLSNLEFWEVFVIQQECSDLPITLQNIKDNSIGTKEAKTKIVSNPLSILTIQPNGCVVGTTTSMDNKEKAAVISYLEEENQKKNFDNKIRFRWSAKTNEEGLYELYVLKATNDGKAAMHDSNMVEKASSDFDEQGHPSVSIQMNDEAARQLSELTGKNVGRPVAIVMDDVVYSAPRVNGQIDGGRSQITGNFTLNDAESLASSLSTESQTQTSIFDQPIFWYVVAVLFALGAAVFAFSAIKAGKKKEDEAAPPAR